MGDRHNYSELKKLFEIMYSGLSELDLSEDHLELTYRELEILGDAIQLKLNRLRMKKYKLK